MIKSDFWVRRTCQVLMGAVLSVALAACGGGGGGDSLYVPPTSPGTPVVTPGVAADLVVVLSKNALANTGSDSLTVTATAIDSTRATVANVPVTFSIDSNAVITKNGDATGTNGTVTASVNEGSDATVRTVTVTATSGSVTRTVSFNVVQSVATTTPQAADLSLALDTSNITNAGSTTVNATAVAVDANRNALTGIPIQISVDSGAIVVVSGPQTDTNGKVTGQVTIGSDHSTRTITVTATSGTLVRTAAFKVTGAALQVTAAPLVNAGTTGNQVKFKLVDVNQNAMVGQTISVVASGLPSASSTTDTNGEYVYNYTAPATAGTITISANAGGTSASATVTVSSGSSSIPNPSTLPTSATLQISPNVVAVNSSGTSNQVALGVNFADANKLVVPNVRVRFDLGDAAYSATNQYGTIGTPKAYSDASGTASATFVPSSIQSPTNGITIRACWSMVDFTSSTDCPNVVTGTLTSVSTPVSITIGTDAKVTLDATSLLYVKRYVVLVNDGAGNPKSDVQLAVSIDLGGYGKGTWNWSGSAYVQDVEALCPNEDLNRDFAAQTGEDINGSSQLEPRKSDVTVSFVGSTKTDANGVAVIQITYPQNLGSWVQYKISASASGVLSPPGYYPPSGGPVAIPSTQYTAGMNVAAYLHNYDTLPIDNNTLTTQTSPPAFVKAPYGVNSDCTSKF